MMNQPRTHAERHLVNGDRVGSVALPPLAHLGLAAPASNRPTKEGRIRTKPDYFDRARSRIDFQPPVDTEDTILWGPWNARDVPSRVDGPNPNPPIDDRLDYGGRHDRRTDDVRKPIARLPPEQADSHDAVAKLAVKDGMVLRLASPRLRADRDIVMMAVAQNAEAMKYAAPALRADAAFIEYMTAEDPLVVDYSDLSAGQKAEMAARVLERAGSAMLFKYAPPNSIYVRLMQDDSFAYQAIRKNRIVAKHRAAYMPGRGLDFFQPLVENDPLLLSCLPRSLALELVMRAPQLREAYINLVNKLKTIGIDHPNRLADIEVVREVVANRETPGTNDSRPVAIVITPAKDWNGAFEMNSIRELTRAYRVMYYESDTDRDFYRAVLDSTTDKKASVLIIGGHGASNLLSFGAEDPAHTVETNEELYLDFSDRAEMVDMDLKGRLAQGAQIVVDSCNAGEGRNTAENIVNLVADAFPNARIYGPTDSTNKVLQFGPDGRMLHPRFLWNVGTYTVEPRMITPRT